MPANGEASHDLLGKLFKAHPWHGIVPGADALAVVNAYIEIVPTDAVKYERDKVSGHVHVDRPQRFSACARRPTASSRKFSAASRWPRSANRAPDAKKRRSRKWNSHP